MSSSVVAPASRPRCVLVLLTGTALAWGAGAVLAQQLVQQLAQQLVQQPDAAAVGPGAAAAWPGRPEDAVVRLCLLALLLAVCAAWLQAVAAVREAWAGAPRPRRAGLVRRAVLAGCGVAVVSVLASVPAQAADHHGHQGPHRLSGLPLPERATGAAPGPVAGPTYRVRAGDSLWSLARDRLGPGAPDAAVARAWHDTYRLNRAVVGADPDLIHPGQRLELPGPTPPAKEPS